MSLTTGQSLLGDVLCYLFWILLSFCKSIGGNQADRLRIHNIEHASKKVIIQYSEFTAIFFKFVLHLHILQGCLHIYVYMALFYARHLMPCNAMSAV